MERNKTLISEVDYNAAVEKTVAIFDAQPGHPDFEELTELLLLIKDFEDRHYNIPNS